MRSTGSRRPSPTTCARSRPGGRSTRTSSTRPTPRSSTTSSSGGWTTTSSTSCPTPPTPTGWWRPSGAWTPRPTGPIIAVQGPRARARTATVVPEAADVPRFGVRRVHLAGRRVRRRRHRLHRRGRLRGARCPTTPPPACGRRWPPREWCPAGLGARDTLRLEAALPLHGHELGPGITPLQAGLGWVVGWDKAASAAVPPWPPNVTGESPAASSGLATEGRQPPREGSTVLASASPVGAVTSGNFSPMLEHGIALALVDSDVATEPGAALDLEQRGRVRPATVVATPFVRAGPVRPGPHDHLADRRPAAGLPFTVR